MSGCLPGGLLRALYAPDSYALVLLLILVTYALSTALTASLGDLADRGGPDRRRLGDASGRPAPAARRWCSPTSRWAWPRWRRSLSLVVNHQFYTDSIVAWVSCALYLAAPGAIVRHLLRRRTIDAETVMGAIAAYLMTGMFFAFLYRAIGIVQTHPPFFGPQGPGTFSQDLFFSFTTLTTTGYGDLTPAGNPGQSFAVLEMLIGQLFLITAVGKVVSSWRPGQGRAGLREKHDDE